MPFGWKSWMMASVVPHSHYGIVELYSWSNLQEYGTIKFPCTSQDTWGTILTTRSAWIIYWLIIANIIIKFFSFLIFARFYVFTIGIILVYGWVCILFPVKPLVYKTCPDNGNTNTYFLV